MNNNSTPNLIDIVKVCCKIGILSFGGPAAQIALMHRIIVEEKQWPSVGISWACVTVDTNLI